MKLGEMLIRDGRLEEADLERVINRQSREGGRLGSLLVAEELIDAETLTVYLGLEFGIPIATMDTFERCKRSAVQLLSPEQAARFRCIPIVIQGQTLIVAVDDPHDMQTLEEIGKSTGYRIIPRVAPEICIYIYLERFYGLPQPKPFAQISKRAGSNPGTAPQKALPAPPLPGLPPQVDEPTPAPGPAPPLRTKRASDSAPFPDTAEGEGHEALELDAADLIEELEADEEAPAEKASPASRLRAETQPAEPPEGMQPEALDQEAALKLISETTKRSDIADAILAHAAELFEVATLLLVRDNMAFGWKGFGPGLDLDRIETLLVPLDNTSMFKAALGDDRHYRARAFPNSLHSHFFRILRTPAPDCSIVVICTIGKRIVNLLYGQSAGGQDLSNQKMDGLMDLMNAAALAYMRLISKSKSDNQVETKKMSTGSSADGAEAKDDKKTEAKDDKKKTKTKTKKRSKKRGKKSAKRDASS